MTYAIIGSGALGSAVARHFARKNLTVALANRRGPTSLSALARGLGPTIIPSELADALQADIVILAVPFTAAIAILAEIPSWDNRIIVDATNAINPVDFSPADLGGKPSTQVLAEAAQGARVVKALNHVFARILAREADDGRGHGRRVQFISGNEPTAKTEFTGLLESFGFGVIDLGHSSEGGLLQQFGGPLTSQSFLLQQQGGTNPADLDLIDP